MRVTPSALTEYAKDAVVEAYTYDYVNYRGAINDVAHEALYRLWPQTVSGFAARERELGARHQGALDPAHHGYPHPPARRRRTPRIAPLLGGDRAGSHRVLFGRRGQPRSRQDFLAHVTILEQKPLRVNLKGIAVDSLVLSPTTSNQR